MTVPGDLAAAIAAAGGAIPFDRFVDCALYGSEGFYQGGGQAGRRGDFITSPEVGPLFGVVLARAIVAEWRRLGSPDHFEVVEVGAGPGTLARSVSAALAVDDLWGGMRPTVRYSAVELSEAQRARHPADVESLAEMPDRGVVGVIIANELLDNLPFRLAVFDDAWREAFVALGRDGSLCEVLSAPIDPLPSFLPHAAPHGSRAPIQDAAAAWVERARGSIERGRVIAFDYCTPLTAELARLPYRSWLRTYRQHQRGQHYLTDAGQQDITTQVCIDQLPAPDVVRTQAQFLHRWGINDLVDEGRAAWNAAAAAPTLAALRMRSRVGEAEALLDPAGLGDFTVMEWAVG